MILQSVSTTSQQWLPTENLNSGSLKLYQSLMFEQKGEARRRLSSVLKDPKDQLRKTKSMKSRVKFQNDDKMLIQEEFKMSREESVVSIGENIAREVYQRFATQKREKEFKKPVTKIYLASPSISREQSRVMDEGRDITASREFCNVIDDSDVIEMPKETKKINQGSHKPNQSPQLSATRQASHHNLHYQQLQQIPKGPDQFQLKNDVQCIVLNNPNIKNLKLNQGQKLTLISSYNDDLVQAKLTYQGRDLTVVVAAANLEPVKLMKPTTNLKILTSSMSSQDLSKDDSQLLRQPSDQCIPTKSLPNFNSFAQSTPQHESTSMKRSTPNPYHKFLQPVGHDSSIDSFQEDDEIISQRSLRPEILNCNQSIPESSFSNVSFKNEFEQLTLIKPERSNFLNESLQEQEQEDQDFMKPSDSSSSNNSSINLNLNPGTLQRSATQSRLIKMQMRKALKMVVEESKSSFRNQRLSQKMSTVQEEQMVSGGGMTNSSERFEKDNKQIVQDKWNNDITEKNNLGGSGLDEGADQFDFTINFREPSPMLKMKERRKTKLKNKQQL